MKKPIFNNFLFCMSLETGGKFIGMLSISIAIVGILGENFIFRLVTKYLIKLFLVSAFCVYVAWDHVGKFINGGGDSSGLYTLVFVGKLF